MNLNFSTKQSGFTLIELLVVIAIIGVLTGVVLVSLGRAREKARDAVRLSDMKQIADALELFRNECGQYPDGGADGLAGTDADGCPVGISVDTFLPVIPTNPIPGGVDYTYTCDDPWDTYTIDFALERPAADLDSGPHTYSPAGFQ